MTMNPNFSNLLAAAKVMADGRAGLKAQELRTVIIRQLSQPGQGRTYTHYFAVVNGRLAPVRKRAVPHRASAPGQSPAVDSGDLRRRISVVKVGPGIYKVGTNLKYAPFLEFGTRKIAARPFMRPALATVRGTP